MQTSEIFRRGVVLPLTDDAESHLRANDVSEGMSVRYLEIADQILFEALWASGVFQRINERAGILIDDYEEEFVEKDALPEIRHAVDEVRSSAVPLNSRVQGFLETLSGLVAEAQRMERPMLFVL